nr:hypothetical protein [Micromonospora endophytica]
MPTSSVPMVNPATDRIGPAALGSPSRTTMDSGELPRACAART